MVFSASHSRDAEFDERLQHRRQVKGGAADDLEHVGSCSLLLQRFGEFFGARAHLVEQSRIFDRYHRLVGKCCEQRHLLFGEGAYRATRQSQDADRASLAQQRCGDHAAIAAEFLCFAELVFWICLCIDNLDGGALKDSSTCYATTARFEGYALQLLFELW